jgi:uncharacterized protein YkvS
VRKSHLWTGDWIKTKENYTGYITKINDNHVLINGRYKVYFNQIKDFKFVGAGK